MPKFKKNSNATFWVIFKHCGDEEKGIEGQALTNVSKNRESNGCQVRPVRVLEDPVTGNTFDLYSEEADSLRKS